MQQGQNERGTGTAGVQGRKPEVTIPQLKIMGGWKMCHLLYLSLTFTVLFAVYLEAWGALLLVRRKGGGVGRNAVIRKGGIRNPREKGRCK